MLGIDWTALRAACSSSIFVTNCWQDPTSQLAILFRIATGRPYALWNDTPDETRRRPFPLRLLRSEFLKLAFRHARAVMGTGLPALNALRRMGCPADRLVDFPYFIDNSHFTPATKPARHDEIVFGSCGRLHSIKGFDIALRALATFKGMRFRYVIAGAGPEAYPLARLASELGIADRVEFRGWVQYRDAPAFLRSLDVFLHPARHEPYGVAVLEAMACGLPVIASNKTAAALDRIKSGHNGFIHRADDPLALAAKIALATSMDLVSIGIAARATAEQWPASRAVSTVCNLIAGRATKIPPGREVERRIADVG